MIESFNSRSEFEQSVIKIFESANQNPTQIIQIFDYDLEFLAKKICVDLLLQFFIKSRKNKLIVVMYDDQKMRKDMARLFNEFQKFSHICEFYTLERNRDKLDDAFVLIESRDLLIRPNRQAFHGNLYLNERELVSAYSERFEELIESSARVSLFTLGL